MSNGCIAPKSPPNAGLPQATNPESKGTLIHRPHQLDKIDYAKNGNIARSTRLCRQWQQILRPARTLHFMHTVYRLRSVPVTSESLMKYTLIARLHLFSVPRRPPGCRGWRWRREAWGDHLAQHSGLMLQQPTLHKHNYETHRACMGPVAALYLWLSLVKSYAALHSLLYAYIYTGYISIQ